MTRQRVLFVTTDPLTEAMPGPAIRAWQLASQLASHHEVKLVSSVACTRSHPDMEVGVADGAAVAALCDWMTMVVGPGSLIDRYPCIESSDKPVVVDIYDPYHLENLAGQSRSVEETDAVVRRLNGIVNKDLARGDFFLCASERQRDFWLGSLTALGRVNARTHEGDEGLSRLVAVVPFGVPATPPVRVGSGLDTVLPKGSRRWPIVLWGGGVYDWFDPLTLLRAVHSLREELPGIFLVFMGMGHPNPQIPEMAVATELRQLAADLGMGPDAVAFNRSWVPFEERGAVLLDADIGATTNLDHLEARFSFRTRMLDYLWAGLPTVATAGDVLSELVAAEGVGVAVAPGDVAAVADGLRRMATSPPGADAVRAVAARFHWDRVVAPLLEYCDDPWRANDRLVMGTSALGTRRPVLPGLGASRTASRTASSGARLASGIARGFARVRRAT